MFAPFESCLHRNQRVHSDYYMVCADCGKKICRHHHNYTIVVKNGTDPSFMERIKGASENSLFCVLCQNYFSRNHGVVYN